MSDSYIQPLSFGLATRRQMLAATSFVLGGFAALPSRASAQEGDGISRTAESIHQEPRFKANRKRVYEALTDSKQFERVVQLSAAMQGGVDTRKKPTLLSSAPGAAFSLFGGYVTGRNVELVSPERIVQAWRAESWEPGIYSIARFVLLDEGTGTKIAFDHTGFPVGQAEHLAAGWRANYWEPLEKFLSAA